MKATDLRLGNLILFTEEIEVVDIITLDQMNSYNGDATNLGYEAIPLTEDILLKCGFNLDKDFNAWQTPHDFHIRVEDNELKQKNKVFWIYFDEQEDHPITCIFELHQLQNLYFALTGEELTIKL